MKILHNFILTALIVAILSWLFIIYVNHNQKRLVSPVLGVTRMKIADNLWFPLMDKFNTQEELANITAEAAIFVDTESGEVIYEKNSKKRLRIASLVKIMTVIVALENKDFDDIFVVSDRAANMEPDKMLLIPGEKMALGELLQGIFLVSANDASEVIAEGTTGRREEFINLMNSKAKQLGMFDTLFINPSGLEEDDPNYPADSGNRITQYSTAYDVSLMARYAIKNWPQLVEITRQPHIYIPATGNHQDYDLYNGINLIETYPGVVGFKTGYTPEAGLTLVTLARNGNKEILGVLLGSTERREDAKALLDYSFKKLRIEVNPN